MNIPYTRAPHQDGASAPGVGPGAPNAALLIDFDNVTMGMRSDLSKELKNLMSSDIIKGKVTVQRAYADWRRYPQYIVPLSEASIDLIFAPAYGSSKKNATDIRMAIDGMELVFIRPEIGTYILLTGDSDFSSLVLKLKEYGKYVIGVGIQESSSDILVQNCDEYYSYTSLTGLRKTGKDDTSAMDPWVLVEKALEQMKRRGDVMRSDRLKQVMLEIDSGFDEKTLGFSKFSRFITEAAKRNLMQIRKLENGQYELSPTGSGSSRSSGGSASRDDRSSRSGRNGSSSGGRPSRRDSSSRSESARSDSGGQEARKSDSGKGASEAAPSSSSANKDIDKAYDLM
ncbi:MAG: NYN domain-containing protein, partial [Gemmatimonadales bacterium]